MFLDARGLVTPTEFGEPFDEPTPYDIRYISPDDLLKVRPIRGMLDRSSISKMAQTLWPNLPW